ncbi:MAG: DUF1736 domain-containing protein [Candidatus Sulfopaludibacter sp.]|nr:DUF1736 domain-containing protein [Candidatus Sulfopaludibacter sp.]
MRRHGLIVAALWALILLANLDSFRDGFPFDNRAAIVMDERVHTATAENVHLIFNQDYWPKQPAGLYRPFTTLSYLFNYVTLGNGVHPAGYHWVNLLLHGLNVVLVYALGLLLFQRSLWAAAMAAVWAVHPLLTESVTNIVGRADILAGLGVLGGLVCYIWSTRTAGKQRRAWLAAAALVTAIGMFSKESAIVVLAAVALWDLAFPETTTGRGGTWAARLPGYVAIGLACAVYLAVRFSVLGKLPPVFVPYADNPLNGADFWTARLTAVKVLGKYLWLLAWPAQLSCDYSYNQIPLFDWNLASVEGWKTLVALASCLALGAAGIACFRRNRIVFFCIGLFFAAMAPTSNLIILAGTIMAERFLYIPAIAFAALLVLLARTACERFAPGNPRAPLAAAAVLGVIGAAFAARTFVRNFDWFDEVQLYAANLVSCPNSFRSHNGLGLALATSAHPELDRAAVEMQRSMEILGTLPDDKSESPPYTNAGFTYRMKGDAVAPAPESRLWYRKSVDVLVRGAQVDAATGRVATERAAEQGVRIARSGWPPLYLELGRSYLRLNEPAKALDALKFGRSIQPEIYFFEEMANAYRQLGDNDQVAVTLMEGLGMHMEYPRFARELVELYRKTAPRSCALRDAPGGSSLNVECPMVHNQLCTATRNVVGLYNQFGQSGNAVNTARSAVTTLGCPAEMFR